VLGPNRLSRNDMTISQSVFCTFFLSIILFSSGSLAGKKRCKSYLDKLHNIQAQQRAGYSASKGISLNEREAKARKTWWDCENNKLPKTKSKKSNKNKKTKKKEYKRLNNKTAGNPFSSVKSIKVQSEYTGEKQKRWMEFYQAPKGCTRSLSLKEFTYCVEDKRLQKEAFEAEYAK